MKFQAIFELEAADEEAAHDQVSTWTVTPGTVLMSIVSVQSQVTTGPVPIDSGNVADHIPPYGSPPIPPPRVDPLTPNFNRTPNPSQQNEQVVLDGSISTGDIASYDWDLGDGETGTGPIVIHTFESTGDFDVTLTITDSLGETASVTEVQTVEESVPASAPVAAFTFSPSAPVRNETVTFDASASSDATDYAWDFGDGNTASGVTATNAYSGKGGYTIQLTVTGPGGTDATTQPVQVN